MFKCDTCGIPLLPFAARERRGVCWHYGTADWWWKPYAHTKKTPIGSSLTLLVSTHKLCCFCEGRTRPNSFVFQEWACGACKRESSEVDNTVNSNDLQGVLNGVSDMGLKESIQQMHGVRFRKGSEQIAFRYDLAEQHGLECMEWSRVHSADLADGQVNVNQLAAIRIWTGNVVYGVVASKLRERQQVLLLSCPI
eukprot:3935986-Rhodomonas_salina.2